MQLWVKLNSLTVLVDVAYGFELNLTTSNKMGRRSPQISAQERDS